MDAITKMVSETVNACQAKYSGRELQACLDGANIGQEALRKYQPEFQEMAREQAEKMKARKK